MNASTPRQIVLCCDGTNNNLTGGENDTNVVRLCQLLRTHGDEQQLVFYDPGVGNPGELPGATVWDSVNRYGERLAGLAFGRGVYENMAECYQFLMSNYQPGDELYIFGFSRGAFTARSVAGLVNMFGILQPHMVSMVPSLLHIYFSDRGGDSDAARRRIARQATQLFADPQEQHVNIQQKLFWADNAQHKRKLLDHWLRDTTINQAIVFASTQIECDGLATDLQQEGFSAVALHGALSQGLRNRRLMALRNGQVQILVATDVAARGIDVPTITHVFNFGLPMKAEDYTHRIGRTGRAGRDGLAVTFAEFRDRRKIFDIEGYSRQQFKAEVIPGLEPAQRMPTSRPAPDYANRGGRDFQSRDRKFSGPARGADRGGFGGGNGGGFGGGFNDRQRVQGRPSDDRRPAAPGGFAGREDRGFAPRRDGDGYGRKPGFGEPARGGFAPRHEGAAPRGDFAPRPQSSFAKPAAGKSFVPHDARKRPARPAR